METLLIAIKILILAMTVIAWVTTVLLKDTQKKIVTALASIFWVLMYIALVISV